MPTEAAGQRRRSDRDRRGEGGQGGAERRGNQLRAAARSARRSGEEPARLKEIISTQREEPRGGGREEEDEGGREEAEVLRWRVNQLEKDRLELNSAHNQEMCSVLAQLARLRCAVERGEAERQTVEFELAVSRREAERVGELSRDNDTLSVRVAELQQTVQELQKVLDMTRQARQEDQHAMQQEVEERDRLVQSVSAENQQLHELLQEQQEALTELERRTSEVEKEREKEAEANRRQASELKYLTEREERSRRERELSDQKLQSLQSSIEAERAAHLESKFNSEIIQLRVRDLEAAVAAERRGHQEALCSLELLRAQLREDERAHSLERERSSNTQLQLHRLQKEHEQCQSDLTVALETERKMTSDLTGRLEEEKRLHANTHSLLEQAASKQSHTEEIYTNCMKEIRETLKHHINTDCSSAEKDHGKQSLAAAVLQLLKTTLNSYQHRLEETSKQVKDLLSASESLEEENQTLRRLVLDQKRQMEESQLVSSTLKEEVTGLRQESSDWSAQSRGLRAELQAAELALQREREEREREREEREREREQWAAEVQRMTEQQQKESQACLSFLHCLYQRLLAGCVLLDQPQSIVGNFTWAELCDVITEQADQLTSDLRRANDQIAQLETACEQKSVCLRELQQNQECVLSRLEESVRRREEAWSSRHTHTVTQLQSELQLSLSQCSSLTSDLSRLRGLLARSRRDSACFLLACALLAGALGHTLRRARSLSAQKALLCRRLAESEELQEEVRRLAAALGGEEEEGEVEGGGRRRRAVRRWRRGVCAVLAVRRFRALARSSTVLFRLERSGGPAVCVCRETTTATRREHDAQTADKHDDGADEGRDSACARWLRSKHLCSLVLSAMSELQGALAHRDSSPQAVTSAARSGLSRLLENLLDQSDGSLSPLQVQRPRTTQPGSQALVSSLQQHFLAFSQRLHSAEVERRSLRLELANQRRAAAGERGRRDEEACSLVPAERFDSVCAELRQALSREQQAQDLVKEQSAQLHTLSKTNQSLLEARQEVSRKERSLRILGKHLSGVQKEQRQLEEELREVARSKEALISYIKAAETSYREVKDSLVQSRRSLTAQPRPSQLPRVHLEQSGAERILGSPEVAACQSLLSAVSELYQACSSRIGWLEQEVSAHHSHVTALRGELQDACLRDNLAYSFVPVAEFPSTPPLIDLDAPHPVPPSDSLKETPVSLDPAFSQPDPAPSKGGEDNTPSKPDPAPCQPDSAPSRPVSSSLHLHPALSPPRPSPSSSRPPRGKAREKKAMKKSRGGGNMKGGAKR